MSKVGIIYWSSTGNTEAMAQAVEEGAKAAGADVEIMEVADADVDKALSYDVLALGCPAMGDEELEEGEFEPFFSAPRLRASIPIAPLPENRSRNQQPGISGWRMLKRVSLIRSVVGRVSFPGMVFKFNLRAFPAMTLISDLISNPDHRGPVQGSEVPQWQYL